MQPPTEPRMVLSPKERLLSHSAAVLQWLNCPEGRLFSDWLEDVRLRENRKLMESEIDAKVYRAQGSVGVIDLIRSLPEDLRQYEKDVISGRIKPLKEG